MLPGKFHCWHVEASRVTWSNWVKLSSRFWALPYTRKNMEKKQQVLTRPNQNCKLNTQGFPIRIARFTLTCPNLLHTFFLSFCDIFTGQPAEPHGSIWRHVPKRAATCPGAHLRVQGEKNLTSLPHYICWNIIQRDERFSNFTYPMSKMEQERGTWVKIGALTGTQHKKRKVRPESSHLSLWSPRRHLPWVCGAPWFPQAQWSYKRKKNKQPSCYLTALCISM